MHQETAATPPAPDERSQDATPEEARSSIPDLRKELGELGRRLRGLRVQGGAAPDSAARQLSQVEVSLLQLRQRATELDQDLADDPGNPTLADVADWRQLVLELGQTDTEQDAARLARDLIQDEAARWRIKVLGTSDLSDPNECFEALASTHDLDHEALAHTGMESGHAAPMAEGRDAARTAFLEALEQRSPDEAMRERWATALRDRADECLTSIDELHPALAVAHLRLVIQELRWHWIKVERGKGLHAKRIRRKLRRLEAETQERELQGRLEAMFGAKRVGLFERLILWLILLVLGILVVEMSFDLSPETSRWLTIVDTGACAVFLWEFFFKLALVRRRGSWFRRHFLVDLIPSIPFALFLMGSDLDPARAGRAVRLLRLPRIARYIRLLMPLIRLIRAFGFMVQGMDRLVRRYGQLLNRNVVLYPNRAERIAAEQEENQLGTEVRRMRAQVNELWKRFLFEAPKEHQPAVAATRIQGLESARAQDLTARSFAATGVVVVGMDQDVPADILLRRLGSLTAEQIEADLGPDFVKRTARTVRIFARPPIRWFPVLRKFVPRITANMSPAEQVAAAAHKIAAQLRRHYDRMFWFADLYGTVTPSESVDRVGTALVKGSFRPAYRLLLFGGLYMIVQLLLGLTQSGFFGRLDQFLEKFVGTPLVVLGSICFFVLGLGWWLKRLASEATALFEQAASAQFIALTEAVKSREIDRDAQIFDHRVLALEAPYQTHLAQATQLERIARFRSRVEAWLIRAQASEDRAGQFDALERVVLLYRDNLDGALLCESDTRTGSQLLGNPALQRLRDTSQRVDRRELKALKALDLQRKSGGFKGPYLWFSMVCRAVARSSARLIVEYNRNAIPLNELPRASEAERQRLRSWLSQRRGPALYRDRGSEAHEESKDYLTSAFTALNFLDDDPRRDREIEQRFGEEVLEHLREDRRLLFRRIFGTYPLHTRPKEQRILNLHRLYQDWFAGGLALLLPLRLIKRSLGLLGSFLAWTAKAAREIRQPRLRTDPVEASQADFATALRKLDRMRGPTVRACIWLRARFDPEYLGLNLPTQAASDSATALVDEDLSFLGHDAEFEQRLVREGKRAEADMRRFHRLMNDGLLVRITEQLKLEADQLTPEDLRAAIVAYRGDFAGVRGLLSCEEILQETCLSAAREPERPRHWIPKFALKRAFDEYWTRHHAQADKDARRASWRAIRSNASGSSTALMHWKELGSDAARKQGVQILANILRHPGRVSEQLVTLRAVQTLSLIDMLNYRNHVYRLGEYGRSGDVPGPLLSLAPQAPPIASPAT